MKKIFRVSPLVGDHQISVTLTDEGAVVDEWIKEFANWDVCFGGETRIMLGMAVEWMPKRHNDDEGTIALLQISNRHYCLIIQMLYLDEITDELIELLESPDVPLAGCGILEDARNIEQQYNLTCSGLVDLGCLASNFYRNEICKTEGLQDLSHQILGDPLIKPMSVAKSDWSRRMLSFDQINYAALDAWTSFSVFRQLAFLSTAVHPIQGR